MKKQTFGHWLGQERKRFGISQAELERVTGIPRQTIWNWENEKHMPHPRKLQEFLSQCQLKASNSLLKQLLTASLELQHIERRQRLKQRLEAK